MPIIKFDKSKLPLVIRTIDKFLKTTVNSDGRIVFTDMTCAHRGGPLTHGEIADKYVVCPWHKYKAEVCKLKKIDLVYQINNNEVSVEVPNFERIITTFTA